MEIEKCRIGQKVRNQNGQDATIVNISNSGMVHVDFGSGCYHYVPIRAECLTPVSDSCQDCEMAATITSQCQKIAELQTALEVMTLKSNSAHRNAGYWREELEKLQQEALAECHPLSEVATIYTMPRVGWPEKPCMSREARRVMELLEASGPGTVQRLAGNLDLPIWQVLDTIVEARAAGKISLVDGKYQMVRE